MIFKLCFNNEIHRCPKAPESFESLVTTIKQTFKESLPENFTLSYKDQDGDRVILNAEDDFRTMVDSCSENQSIKVVIIPEGKGENAEEMMSPKISKSSIEEQIQVPSDKNVGENQIQEKIIEVPDQNIIQENQNKEERELIGEVVEDSIAAAFEKRKDEIPVDGIEKDNREEFKEGDMAEVVENDCIDLADKGNLRAFIIQTIEEEMPRLMANYLHNKGVYEKSKKDENSVIQGIKNVANQITTRVEKIVSGQKEGLWVKISKIGKIVPEAITTIDELIYVMIVVKNTGTDPFPANSFLQSTSGLTGEMINFPSLEAKKELKATLILKAPKKAGNFISKWRLGCLDQQNETKHFGEELELKFTISEKEYPKFVHDKALQMKDVLPEVDISLLLEFVSQDPRKKIEILIDEFLLNCP